MAVAPHWPAVFTSTMAVQFVVTIPADYDIAALPAVDGIVASTPRHGIGTAISQQPHPRVIAFCSVRGSVRRIRMRQHVSPIAPDAIRAIFSTSTTGVVVAVVAGAIIRIPNAGPMVCFWVAAKLVGNVRTQVPATVTGQLLGQTP